MACSAVCSVCDTAHSANELYAVDELGINTFYSRDVLGKYIIDRMLIWNGNVDSVALFRITAVLADETPKRATIYIAQWREGSETRNYGGFSIEDA